MVKDKMGDHPSYPPCGCTGVDQRLAIILGSDRVNTLTEAIEWATRGTDMPDIPALVNLVSDEAWSTAGGDVELLAAVWALRHLNR